MATSSIAPSRLRHWIAAFLRSAQVPEEEAQLIAGVRLEAALRDPLGFDAFAARSLGHVVERLRSGGLNPHPTIHVVQEDGPLALMDGDGGIGQLVGVRAMEHCLHLAEVHGIGTRGGAAVVIAGGHGVLCHDGSVAWVHRLCGDQHGVAYRHATLGRGDPNPGEQPLRGGHSGGSGSSDRRRHVSHRDGASG